jgi:hypothetical protein
MTWKINDKELTSVLRLPLEKRYQYFVKHVADWREMWSLANANGWVLYGTKESKEVVPVWPHSAFAKVCATGEWSDCEPRSIDLDEWIETWTSGLIRDQRLVGVFPTPNSQSVVVTPQRLADDLHDELTSIED